MTDSPCTRSAGDPRELPGFRRTYAPGRLTLGLGFPLRTRADGD
ncbi:LLM class flavin-dependent oxidoreductase, partial [Dietzia sp. DQ11-71]|nr:LLM class flavin-dependent oxidoreductase [Dietzia sp. DQ11-71]